MKRMIRLVAAVISAVTMLAMMVPAPADAATVAFVQGVGTITPGIPTDPLATVSNSVTFGGTMTGVLGTSVGSCAVSVTGVQTDTLAMGNGSGTMNCSGGPTGPSMCTINWRRVGIWLLYIGTCQGPFAGTVVWLCVLVPNNVPPTSYTMVCKSVIVPI